MKHSVLLMAFACAVSVLLAGALVSVTPALAGQVLATGQTTASTADKNDSITGAVAVPDDGTSQLGAPLQYKELEDGTIKDLNTGLIWEKKCSKCGGLHDVSTTYLWSGNGSQETIWDWLDDLNAEGGTGYAGHNDWRIPNLRELQSIVDYGLFKPTLDPIFGPTRTDYWTSTTFANNPASAWLVDFGDGNVDSYEKDEDGTYHVRAVRGGRNYSRVLKGQER
jgi:Protein of unknown function (DUF1566)